ncbi:UNVERIFIED_CONTAM: hypothetical protein HDU68_009581 [Siphonaria sp. JEL0065]|nr:hypothetical protein HDU68_009581 [Siphonaria sp. JEL0065]
MDDLRALPRTIHDSGKQQRGVGSERVRMTAGAVAASSVAKKGSITTIASNSNVNLQWENQPTANYNFAPPAAPKYFLWFVFKFLDNTPTGPVLAADSRRLGLAAVRVHACAFAALQMHVQQLTQQLQLQQMHQLQQHVGFLLGRIASSDLLDTRDSGSVGPDFVIAKDGSVLLKKVLILDRFDAGRKFHSKEDALTPTVVLDGDTVVKEDAYKFYLSGDSNRVIPSYEENKASNHTQNSIDDDIVCVLEMAGLDIRVESDLVNALEKGYGIKVAVPPPDPEPETTSNTRISVKTHCQLDTNESVDELTPKEDERQECDASLTSKVAPDIPEEQNTPPASAAQYLPFPPQPSQSPGLDPFQLMQQQHTQMYMMLMQRQYEMMLALTNPAVSNNLLPNPVVPTVSSSSQPFSHPSSPNSSTRTPPSHSIASNPANVSTSSTSCSTQTIVMRTIGTNTSFLFPESAKTARSSSQKPIETIKEVHQLELLSTVEPSLAVIDLSLPSAIPSFMSSAPLSKAPRPNQTSSSPPTTTKKSSPPNTTIPKGTPKQSLGISPPTDTGNNYKPLYTFDSIPVQSVDQTMNIANTTSANTPSLTRTVAPTVNNTAKTHSGTGGSRLLHRPPMYPAGGTSNACRRSFLNTPPVETKRKPPIAALPYTQEIQPPPQFTSNCILESNPTAPSSKENNNRTSGIGGMVCAASPASMSRGVRGLDSQIMISLDLSGIENDDLIGDATFEDTGMSELEDERTRELIAQLVEHPEQSFIFHDAAEGGKKGVVSPERKMGREDGINGRDLLVGDESVGLSDRSFVLNDDASFFGAKSPNVGGGHGKYDLSSTREQFSKATLEYLAKYGLE